MTSYALFLIQAALMGVEAGVTVAYTTPATVGLCVFVALLTLNTLLQQAFEKHPNP